MLSPRLEYIIPHRVQSACTIFLENFSKLNTLAVLKFHRKAVKRTSFVRDLNAELSEDLSRRNVAERSHKRIANLTKEN